MGKRTGPSPRTILVWVVALLVFAFSGMLRFNDPGGSFAGLTDDHFFYLTRGWQILFGDLPVRDFVDHGAPAFYYVGAAVQWFGRGTLSELVFTSGALALGAALTFWLAERASGSIVLGLAGAAFQVLLEPRFYNYPKLLAYAAAIPLLWWFADRPGGRPRFWLAACTVVAFLFRHDHGVFIAVAMAVQLVLQTNLRWTEKLLHAVLYGAIVIALVSPYLLFIQVNGGLVSYFDQASAWADRDRDRAPVVWPDLFDNPDGVSDQAQRGEPFWRAVAVVRDNFEAWAYYAEILLPVFAGLVLLLTKDAARPGWPEARAKIGTIAALALVLDAGFLRSPLEARLADPSVPLAILVSWLLLAVPTLIVSRKALSPSAAGRPGIARVAAGTLCLAFVFVLGAVVSKDAYRKLDKASMAERVGKAFERIGSISRQVTEDWRLESWAARQDRPDLVNLSLYVNACTRPNDRVLVQGYMPQVLALARRAFAGGHADLRPGFFGSDEAQRLTLARLRRQSVPIILLDTDESLLNFKKEFPLVWAHIDADYRLAGSHVFDDRFGVSLFVRRDRTAEGTWAPLAWPCYGRGSVAS